MMMIESMMIMMMMMMGENEDEDDVNCDGNNDDNIQPGWVDGPCTTSSLDNRMLKFTGMTPNKV